MEVGRQVAFWISVAAGGATGAVCRHALGASIARRLEGPFPWATLAINVLGCLAIGILFAAFQRPSFQSPLLRASLVIGFLGGFTTFSAYGVELLRMAQADDWMRMGAYALASNLGGFGAVWLGYQCARFALK